MRKNKLLLGLITILLVSSMILAGCGGGQTAGPVGGGDAREQVKWTMSTTWAEGWLLHDMATYFAKQVKEMSGGNFIIDVYPSGAIVGGLEVLDATHTGTIDAYHSWPGYWMGLHPSAPFFASIPMHFEPLMHTTWLYAYGGMELMQQMYDEIGMNVYSVPGGVTHPEVLAHSNKPLETLSDWRGLKYRAPGWWGEIL